MITTALTGSQKEFARVMRRTCFKGESKDEVFELIFSLFGSLANRTDSDIAFDATFNN